MSALPRAPERKKSRSTAVSRPGEAGAGGGLSAAPTPALDIEAAKTAIRGGASYSATAQSLGISTGRLKTALLRSEGLVPSMRGSPVESKLATVVAAASRGRGLGLRVSGRVIWHALGRRPAAGDRFTCTSDGNGAVTVRLVEPTGGNGEKSP